MRTVFLLSIALSCACSSPKVEAIRKAEERPATKSTEVVVSAEAQRMAGIVTEALANTRVPVTIEAPGVLALNEEQTAGVGAVVEGRLTEIDVNVGDSVHAGQVLARMHSHEVHDARAAYRKAQDDLQRAKAAEELAIRLRDRAKRLFELKAGSRHDLDQAEMEVKNAQTARLNAQTELQRNITHIEEYLEVPLEDPKDDHSHSSDDVPLKAPASGVVIARHFPPGSVVSVGQEVFRIANLSSLWMIANVNEADLESLRPGQAVHIKVRAHGDRSFAGRVLRLGEALDPTTRTLKVRILVPNQGGLLKPEMYATAHIERQRAESVLTVPEEAVQELNGIRVVFVKTGTDRFEARPVDVGRRLSGRVELLAGLVKPGDQMVTKGSFVLKSQMLKSTLAEEE